MFDKEFLFGASISGFQFEMGGKIIDPNTDWFKWVHDKYIQESGIVSGHLPEDGPNYWEHYPEVHDLAVKGNFNALRIGIEWSRIFPRETFEAKTLEDMEKLADKQAISHYRGILEDIKSKGMKLMLNLNHFTLPLWLHDPIKVNRYGDFSQSGWLDDRSPVEFAKFAAFIVREFDSLVDYWSTMNEPNVVANLGYFQRESGFPPSIIRPELWRKALENEIKAHNLAYKEMKKFTSKPVGIIYASNWVDGDESREDAMNLLSWYFMDSIRENMDFVGINYYSRIRVVKRNEILEGEGFKITWKTLPGYGFACMPNGTSRSGLPVSDTGWEVYPKGLYEITKAVCERYGKPVYITENGIADGKDSLRPYYLISHLWSIEKLLEEGYDVRGYFHWSLIDNYEWAKGFTMRFGLVHVNYAEKSFTPRPSFLLYSEIIKERTTEKYKEFIKYPHALVE
ncbi:beta-galactosidase BgaS [Kosmotoga pacifica]|nr:beta-galactosidase BgaS [Kosmotoga pacifica]